MNPNANCIGLGSVFSRGATSRFIGQALTNEALERDFGAHGVADFKPLAIAIAEIELGQIRSIRTSLFLVWQGAQGELRQRIFQIEARLNGSEDKLGVAL